MVKRTTCKSIKGIKTLILFLSFFFKYLCTVSKRSSQRRSGIPPVYKWYTLSRFNKGFHTRDDRYVFCNITVCRRV